MSSARDNNAEVYASGSFAQSYDVEEITIYTRPTNRTPVNPDDESSQANPRASRTPSQSGLLQRVSSRNLNVPEDNPTKSSLLDQLDIHTPPVYSTPKLFATIAGLAVFAASSAAVLVGLACYKFGNKLTPEPLLTKVHYVMQMCGFVAFIHSVVIYRLYGISFKYLRIMHVCSHLTALFTLLAGVAMRVHAKMKYPVYGATVAAGVNKYEPHLFTLHSFIATASLIMYMFQLVGSAYLFSMSMRKNIITFHREIGILLCLLHFIYFTSSLHLLYFVTSLYLIHFILITRYFPHDWTSISRICRYPTALQSTSMHACIL